MLDQTVTGPYFICCDQPTNRGHHIRCENFGHCNKDGSTHCLGIGLDGHESDCPYQAKIDLEVGVMRRVNYANEIRLTSGTGGQKGIKPERFDLIPVGPLMTLAELYGKGAEKYDENNWRKGYSWSLSYQALMRHAVQFWAGEDNDKETGLPHMASVAFHAFALTEFMKTHPEYDDRYKKSLQKGETDA